jgi:hypothetical protein
VERAVNNLDTKLFAKKLLSRAGVHLVSTFKASSSLSKVLAQLRHPSNVGRIQVLPSKGIIRLYSSSYVRWASNPSLWF